MKLKVIFFFTLFYCLAGDDVSGQSVMGKWKTYDVFDNTIEESIVDIYKFENQLFIKIDKIIPEEHINDLCINCKGKDKDQPVLGMIILEGAVFHEGVWQGAQILNAKNGKRYGCHISLEENDLLKVRGFVGYPFFGKTLFWTRVKDSEYR
jgi:uncharacterized protein (DUF2147 family)